MKVVILAGGIGSRITEESHLKPKPMIEIGDQPILWHIMKIYAAQGFNDFIICLGHKGKVIKEYFLNYYMYNSDLSIDISTNKIEMHVENSDKFNVTLVNTGLNTQTAGRIKRIEKYIDDDTFMLTYGDGVANVNLNELLEFHRKNAKLATVTAVQPPHQFGRLVFAENGTVEAFREKLDKDSFWINGGFFVLNKGIFEYLDANADQTMWEDSPLEKLTADRQLVAYKHHGYWKNMDAMRDKIILDDLWNNNRAPWKIW